MNEKYAHLKNKLDLISKDAPIRNGDEEMIELDPKNKDHVEWFEENIKRTEFDNKIAAKKKQMTTEKKRQMLEVGGSIKTNNYIDAEEICREVRGK